MVWEHFVLDWLNLGLRWTHFIVGVAWIGASFYFNWLEGRLNRAGNTDPQLAGDLWAVHGGGFYHVRKLALAPQELPTQLHWFKWEAYFTWLTGFLLLVVVYYTQAEALLINPTHPLPAAAAIAIGVTTLVAGWLVYDLMDRMGLADSPGWFAAAGFCLLVCTAYLLGHLFSPRAAYIHVGAVIGTIMVGNVFRVIIPAQRDLVTAAKQGSHPDAARARQAGRRSRHNNYLTLPVLFIMISGHYPATYGHEHAWAVLAILSLIGVGLRHYFNLRHNGRGSIWMPVAAVLAFVALALWIDRPWQRETAAAGAVSIAQVRAVTDLRCAPCHSATPTQPGFAAPPGGVMFDNAGQVRLHAQAIGKQAVTTRIMPPGNLTGMTDDERALLRQWLAGKNAL